MNDVSQTSPAFDKHTFREALTRRPLVFDGAMGTMLYEKGYFINRAFDEANLVRADSVLSIHREHADAGAEILETNTFSANRYLLDRYGVREKVLEINRAGVRLAREAAAARAWVAGSIGPTGEGIGVLPRHIEHELRTVFAEQIATLVDEGVDLLVLETFHHLGEMRIALDVARQHFDGAIVAQMTFGEDGYLRDGTPPAQVAQMLGGWGADVVGVNCGEGPALILDIAREMVSQGLPVSAQPNAGRPRKLDTRSIYMTTPEYIGVHARRFLKAGVRLVGGCCGTRPEHTTAIANAVRMFGGDREAAAPLSEFQPGKEQDLLEPVPLSERSRFAAKVQRVFRDRLDGGRARRKPEGPRDFCVSVEVNSPTGLDPAKQIRAARSLFGGGVDVVNIADGPRASARMNNTALALLLQRELECEVILHVCCRDRNLLGLQGDILGAHALGLHNMVIITGDPPKLGDYPKATAVFDLDSVELLEVISGLNRGIDPAGRSLGDQTRFFLATGAEPAALDYERELSRLQRKVQAGAELIMTQPVYDPEVVERFLNDVEHLERPVLLGICPLVSARNAEFLHNEVPGMSVPDDIRARMAAQPKGQKAQQEGAAIAREMVMKFCDRVVGAYVMPQLGRYGMAFDVLGPLGYAPPETGGSR